MIVSTSYANKKCRAISKNTGDQCENYQWQNCGGPYCYTHCKEYTTHSSDRTIYYLVIFIVVLIQRYTIKGMLMTSIEKPHILKDLPKFVFLCTFSSACTTFVAAVCLMFTDIVDENEFMHIVYALFILGIFYALIMGIKRKANNENS